MTTMYCTLETNCPDKHRCVKKFSPHWDKMCWRASPYNDPDPPGPVEYPKVPQPGERPQVRLPGIPPPGAAASPSLPPELLALNQPWAPGATIQRARDESGRLVVFVPLMGGRRFIVSREGGDTDGDS